MFFASVENLYLSEELGEFVARPLREHAAGENVAAQVLPTLKKYFHREVQVWHNPRRKSLYENLPTQERSQVSLPGITARLGLGNRVMAREVDD